MAHRLPEELTSFVGRESELAELDALLSTRRLVTVTGSGGGGKTRLAVQLGARIGDRWSEGAWLVDLGPVTDPALVPQVVAATLEVLVEPADPAAERASLAARIGDRRMLLFLDTCEHVLDAAAELAETLLRRCPELTLLATSREPLGVPGEAVWRIPPLRAADAHQLFAERATLVEPHFDPVAGPGRHRGPVRPGRPPAPGDRAGRGVGARADPGPDRGRAGRLAAPSPRRPARRGRPPPDAARLDGLEPRPAVAGGAGLLPPARGLRGEPSPWRRRARSPSRATPTPTPT